MAWLGFEPRTTEFCSYVLTDWPFKPWVEATLTVSFLPLLQFHYLFSVKFHFGYFLHQSPRLFQFKFSWVNHMSVGEWMIQMAFITEEFFELAIESWPQWGIWTHVHWIPFRRSNQLSYQTVSSARTQSQLCRATSISSQQTFVGLQDVFNTSSV